MEKPTPCPTCGQLPTTTVRRTPLKSALAALGTGLAGLYLLNPGAGLFEALPDNLPLVGQLDEGAAVLLLTACLSYFGVRLPFPIPVRASRRGR